MRLQQAGGLHRAPPHALAVARACGVMRGGLGLCNQALAVVRACEMVLGIGVGVDSHFTPGLGLGLGFGLVMNYGMA